MLSRRAGALLTLGLLTLAPPTTADQQPDPCDCFGTPVSWRDADVGASAFVFAGVPLGVDLDNGGALDGNDLAILTPNPWAGAVLPGSLRMTGAPGSWVVASDPEAGASAFALPGRWAFEDQNQNFAHDGQDPLYWDTDDSGTVTRMDLRVTQAAGEAAGAWVNDDDADLGGRLIPSWGAPAYKDYDADGTMGPGDIVYFDTHRNFGVDPGDVRLTGRPIRITAEPVAAPLAGAAVPALRAYVADGLTGHPIPNLPVTFYAGEHQLCTALTNPAGEAVCTGVAAVAMAAAAGGYAAAVEAQFPFCSARASGAVTSLDGEPA